MGQVCSGDKPEAKKSSAFQDASDDTMQSGDPRTGLGGDTTQAHSQLQNQQQASSSTQPQASDAATAAEDRAKGEKLKALREEQTRLDLIVSAAGRGMVAVRSTRGSTGYYDQGFAAALAQHLEQTTKFPNQLPIQLPPPPSKSTSVASHSMTGGGSAGGSGVGGSSSSASSPSKASGGASGDDTTTPGGSNGVYARLAQPPWQGIQLGTKGTGIAGCAGENPNTYMDHVAESLLEDAVPSKQQMLLGAKPIIENLL